MLSKLICVMYVDHLYTMFHYLIYPQMLHMEYLPTFTPNIPQFCR